MYEIERLPQSIDIGYTGEMDFRTVQIDMSEWVAKMPEGQPTLMHIRPGEYDPYPVTITYENNIITWSVTDGDLGTSEGTGLLQVWFGVQDETEIMRQLGMSAVVPTIIHLSLAGEGRNSSTVQIPWLKEVMEMKNLILGYDYEAESWANGQRGGTDVPSTDPAYHNNAKYYSEQASAAKTAAEAAQEAAETAAERDVEAWLEENFTNPDSPPLDRTLALDTCAAPADMVGNIKSAIDVISSPSAISVANGITITGGIRSDGTNGDTSSFSSYVRSDYIPVVKGMIIKYANLYAGTNISVLAIYDETKTKLSVVPGNGVDSGYEANGEITVTQDGYFRVSTKASPPKAAVCTVQNAFVVDREYNLVSFGDALTAGRIIGGNDDYDEANSYPEIFGKLYGYNVTNAAVNGQGFVGGTATDTAYDTVEDSETEITAADLITLKWGNNDPSVAIGNTSTSGTILYELNRIINYIRTKNDHCQIVVLSPGNVSSFGSVESRYWYDYLASGWSLSDYNRIVGDYCHSIGIKYIDVNGWCAVSDLADCLGDGTHPTVEANGVYSNYVMRCIAESLVSDENRHDCNEIAEFISKDIDLGTLTDNSYINRSDGTVATDSTTYRSSDFVPVIGGFGIEFNNVFQRGNCCVAQYKADKSFISAFYGSATYISSFRATLHSEAAFIRVTGRKSPYPAPTAKYYNYAGDVAKGIFDQTSETVSPTISGSGALLSNGKTVASDNAISYTDYVSVDPFDVVTVTKVYPTANSGVFMFDSDKTLTGRVRALTDGNTTAFTMLIPANVHYIRYNVTNANASSTTVTKIKTTPETDATKQVKNIAGMSGLYLPFSRHKKRHKPLITIIDDDTTNVANVTKFHDACVDAGIKGTYAVITNNMVNTTGLKNLLLSYETEGFQMVTHCMEQLTYMREDSTAEQQALVRTNMVTAQRAMQDAGFLNYKYWVTPYGRHSAFYQKLAKELGFKCLVSLPQLVYEGYTPLDSRWFIPRMELYPDDTSGNQTLQDIKDQIDQCVAANGWLLVATHFYENAWTAETIAARFGAMVDYALDAGMEHVTLAEGFEYWRSVYDFYDMFD